MTDSQDCDQFATLGLWSIIIGSLALLALAGHLMPKQLKYGALALGGTAALVGVAYESREETKLLRAQGRQLRRQAVQQLANQHQNRMEQANLSAKIEAEGQTLKLVDAMPEPLKAAMGVPSVGLGTPMDADPSTMTVDIKPTAPVVHSPRSIAKTSGASNGLQQYIDFLTKAMVSKFGRQQMSLCLYGASRDGKSTLAQALVYTVALQAIAHNNRAIVMVLTRHGIDWDTAKTDPFHPIWNGIPEAPGTPDGLESSVVKCRPGDVARHIAKLRKTLETRIAQNDYSWSNPESKTPQIILIADDAAPQFRAMEEATRADAAADIAAIAQDGSKFGIGVWLLMHDITKERTGVDPNAWESMHMIYGRNALKGKSAVGVEGRDSALAMMKQSKEDTGIAGYYSESLGYLVPPPIQSVGEFAIDWAVPAVDVFDAQISLVNVLRERVQDVAQLEDQTLTALGVEWSTFTADELQRMMPAIRALLALPSDQYESKVAKARNKVIQE